MSRKAISVITVTCFIVLTSSAWSQWSSVNPPNVSKDWLLTEVYFPSPDEGWAVGADATNKKGILLHYSVGTWTSVFPPDVSRDWSLRGIFLNSVNEGWAAGWDRANRRGV